MSDDTIQCEHPNCEERATGVYEGDVPPAGTFKYVSCGEHPSDTCPLPSIEVSDRVGTVKA